MKKFIILQLLMLFITMVIGTVFFVVPKKAAKADTNYVVKFYNGDTMVDIISVAVGDGITAGQIREIENNLDIDKGHRVCGWQYLVEGGGSLNYVELEDYADDDVVIANIANNIEIQAMITTIYIKVSFIMPDGTVEEKNVMYGDSVEGPVPENLQFGDRVTYDRDLSNITETIVVNVKVNHVLKYIMIISILLVSLTAIITVSVIALKSIDKKQNKKTTSI